MNDLHDHTKLSVTEVNTIVADRQTPPSNGAQAFEKLERALHSLGTFDLTAAEFCVPSTAQDTTRVAQLRRKRTAEIKEAEDAAASASSSSLTANDVTVKPLTPRLLKYSAQ